MSARLPLPVLVVAALVAAGAGLAGGRVVARGAGPVEEAATGAEPRESGAVPRTGSAATSGDDGSALRTELASLRARVASAESRTPKEHTAAEWKARAKRLAELMGGDGGNPDEARELRALMRELDPAMVPTLLEALSAATDPSRLVLLVLTAGGPDAADWVNRMLSGPAKVPLERDVLYEFLGHGALAPRFGNLVADGPLFETAKRLAVSEVYPDEELGVVLLSLRDCDESRRILTARIEALGNTVSRGRALTGLCRVATPETEAWFTAWERRLPDKERASMKSDLAIARQYLRRRELERNQDPR